MITLEHFDEVDMRVGTITAVIGDVKSEVRLLGSDTDEGCILLTSLTPVKNGSKIF